MSTNTSSNQDQEIDLSQISKSMRGIFQGIKASIYKDILFFKKNIVIITSLIIVGASVGYFIDTNIKTYNHQIIVNPNFGSTDYLYAKIDLIESKIKQRDTAFLKSIGIANPSKIAFIEINPIIDIYNFVNTKAITDKAENSPNFEMVKLLAEDGDINKVIKDKLTSKNYSRHTINIVTKDIISEENTITPLLKYLNQNDYFNKVRSTANNNIILKMKKNEEMITQIDNLLNEFSSSINSNQNSNKLVYYNENTQINAMISSKNDFIYELGSQRTELLNIDTFIKKICSVTNVQNTKNISGKLKFVLPIFLIFGFILLRIFTNFYKNQKALLESNQ
jgi:hypothetical protein